MPERGPAGRFTLGCFALGQVCLLGVTPLLTRHFSVTDISIYQLGFALAIILQPLSTLRLELVVPVRTLSSARRMLRLSLVTNLGLSAVLAAAAGALYLGGGESASHASNILLSSGLIVLVIGNTAADNSWLIRRGKLRALAMRNLGTGALGGLFQLAVAFLYVSEVSLALAYVAARIAAVVLTIPLSRGGEQAEVAGGDDSQRYTWKRATASILSLSLSSIALQAPVVVVAIVLGTSESGQLSLAQRVAGVPGSLLSLGVAQYITYRASTLIRTGNAPLLPLVRQVSTRLIVLGLAVAPLLAIAGPTLTPFVFGEQWRTAGYALAILAIPFGLQISVFPMLSVYGLVGRDFRILVLQAVRAAALVLCTLIAAVVSHSVLITAGVASGVISASYLSIIVGARRVAGEFDRHRHRPTTEDADSGLGAAESDGWVAIPQLSTATAAGRPAAGAPRHAARHAADAAWSQPDTGPVRQPHAATATAAMTYCIFAALTAAFIFGVMSRGLLPSRYFNDDARIQQFIQYPYLVTRDGSYRGTANVYRLLHLGGHAQTVAIIALLLYGAILLRCLHLTADARKGLAYWGIVAGSIAFGAIYLPLYSKEFVLLPIVLAFVSCTSPRTKWLWIILAVAYAYYVRSYWFGVVGLYLANSYVSTRVRSTKARAAYVATAIIGLAFVLSTGIGNSVGYERASTLAHLSFDPTTAISTPFGAGFLQNIGNVAYVFLTLLVPVPLVTKGVVYLVAAVFVTTCWITVIRTAADSDYRHDPARSVSAAGRSARDAACFLLAYVMTLALFEPDYGSYLRHLTPLLPLVLLTRPVAERAEVTERPSTAARSPGSSDNPQLQGVTR